MWKSAMAETDDDLEWIPNPRQKGMLPNLQVTQEMIDGWMGFLDEAQAILEGKKLIPFWRDSTLGVNLRKVFLEPRTLDMVLWIQGTAAAPYLEKGEQSQGATWDRFQRVFRGEFLLFALWWN